jgi:hypothetical protein
MSKVVLVWIGERISSREVFAGGGPVSLTQLAETCIIYVAGRSSNPDHPIYPSSFSH